MRQRDIFFLLAQGLATDEIAARLLLSPGTVRTHMREGMRRLGARTRPHAVALAISHSEISEPFDST